MLLYYVLNVAALWRSAQSFGLSTKRTRSACEKMFYRAFTYPEMLYKHLPLHNTYSGLSGNSIRKFKTRNGHGG